VRAVVTRVSSASVTTQGRTIGQIGAGLLILLGVAHADTDAEATGLAENGGAALVVSQFTLLGDARRGRRPSFMAAAAPELGRALYERFVEALRGLGVRVETGEFGADMAVASVNEGPVTILIDTTKLF
jgi:D-tyrosyl-tRNA(Tyr) deacylase